MIPVAPEEVYSILADYRGGHPAILPRPYFERLTVIEGGVGAGTIAEVHMNVFGAKSVLRLETTEPEPGRVLVETDPAAGVTTTFTVDPANGGEHARVTIETAARTRAGLPGLLERLLNPVIMRRIYRAELIQLAEYAATKRSGTRRAREHLDSDGSA